MYLVRMATNRLFIEIVIYFFLSPQDLYCVRSDLGNLLKALGRLEEAKVCYSALAYI